MYTTDEKNLESLLKNYQGLLRKAAGQNHLRSFYEEAYAQAVLSFCEAVRQFDASRSIPFAGYVKAKIYGDLYTLFKKQRRSWQRELPLEQADNNSSSLINLQLNFEDRIIDKNILAIALKQLSTRQRQIIDYTLLQGFTQTETAGFLQISQQAVAAGQKQALALLKKTLT
ncbi:sigma-70 family RNA polymerase sigma factor [Pectinatus frisingensis]|uniref:sigma-70 family RNA polymerase sigma factor n=1 Tax=Pectinatus frisingensis TaxID=865 RepID=UPI003D805509